MGFLKALDGLKIKFAYAKQTLSKLKAFNKLSAVVRNFPYLIVIEFAT